MADGLINKINSALADYFGQYNKTLWEGTLNSGSITVPGTSNYCVFAIYSGDNSVSLASISNNGKINFLVGAVIANSNNQYIDIATMTTNGDVWTLTKAIELPHNASSSHGSAVSFAITKIVGILPKIIGGGA